MLVLLIEMNTFVAFREQHCYILFTFKDVISLQPAKCINLDLNAHNGIIIITITWSIQKWPFVVLFNPNLVFFRGLHDSYFLLFIICFIFTYWLYFLVSVSNFPTNTFWFFSHNVLIFIYLYFCIIFV